MLVLEYNFFGDLGFKAMSEQISSSVNEFPRALFYHRAQPPDFAHQILAHLDPQRD